MMAVMNDANGSKTLVRTRDGRIVAGVCSGLGEYFGLDVNLIRLILAVITVFSAGVGALAYLAAWVVIPEEGEKTSIAENIVNKNRKQQGSPVPQAPGRPEGHGIRAADWSRPVIPVPGRASAAACGQGDRSGPALRGRLRS